MKYCLCSIRPSTLILSASLFLFSCAQPANENAADSMQNYQHTFTSVGYAPIALQKGESFDLQMLNAIKASKLEAYKELAEQIYGVLLSAENNMSKSRLQEDQIKSTVKGLVRGARVLRSYHEGDVYITELELNMQTLPFLDAPQFGKNSHSVINVENQVYY